MIVDIEASGVKAAFRDAQGSVLAGMDMVAASPALGAGVFPNGISRITITTAANAGMTIESLQLFEPAE